MSREQERIRKKLENNPIVECNKIQKKFCPELFSMFGEVADPRHQSYIKYSARTMLWTATNKNRRYKQLSCKKQFQTDLILAKKVMPAKRKNKNLYTFFWGKA